MITPLLELEGTVEEIQIRLADFAGQRLHVTVQPIAIPADAPHEVPPKHGIIDKILARAQAIPPQERAKMPVDLAEQHDHYIYGLPKR